MIEFKDLGIATSASNFVGSKVKVNDIINLKIVVEDYKVKKSKFEHLNSEECLWLQIKVNDKRRVLFTGSKSLLNTIKRVPKDAFPFRTTIIKSGKSYQFS